MTYCFISKKIHNHMQQKNFLILALIISVFGILILFIVTPDISPQSITIKGRINNITNTEKLSEIHFTPYDFKIISFKNFNHTGPAKLIGKLASYNGKLEFIVEDIR